MIRATWCALALALAMSPAHAQDAELSKLREEMRQLQQRLQVLEKKLQETEEKASAREPAATPSQPSVRQNESALNPGISAILNGVYGNFSRDPNNYRLNGFVPSRGEVSPGRRGLSLGESELGFVANVDHMFRGTLIASISPEDNTIGVEEGYIQTIGLSKGVTIKAGRFFSAVGYQNQVHAHAWDFTDMPLANKVFLGNQLKEDGVQLRWVAPTSLYFDIGVELGRGRAFPAGPDGGRNRNGLGSSNLFAHLGGDIGESLAWQAGLSHLSTSPRERAYNDVDSLGTGVTNAFSGKSALWVADAVLKWAPEGNPTDRNFKLQGEYFSRKESGALAYDTAAASRGTMNGSYASRQSGWYMQGVYQFMPQWRVGYRYDQLNAGTATLGLIDSGALTAADFPILGGYNPKRNTVMIDWSPSEFSRIRLQFARDYSRMGEPDSQVFLQYIMSLGAHGAHRF